MSSDEECESAIDSVRLKEADYSRSGGKYKTEELEKHEFTAKMIRKHESGELELKDYSWACQAWGGEDSYHPYTDPYWKKRFLNAVSGNDTSAHSKKQGYLARSTECPAIVIMSDELYQRRKAEVEAVEDFTHNLRGALKKAVRSARAYLNSNK